MPLAGGRGIQSDLNGEMDSLSLRIANDYRNIAQNQQVWSTYDIADSIHQYVNVGYNDLSPYIVMLKMPKLSTAMLIARISIKALVIYSSGSDTTNASKISNCLYTYEKSNLTFKRVDGSANSFTLGTAGLTGNRYNQYFHNNLEDGKKFRVNPREEYYCAVQVVDTIGGNVNFGATTTYLAGSATASTSVLTISGTPASVFMPSYKLTDFSTTTEVTNGTPNIIFSSADAQKIFVWP